jgi:glycosyltransferase involved in cell wall biosynthesis
MPTRCFQVHRPAPKNERSQNFIRRILITDFKIKAAQQIMELALLPRQISFLLHTEKRGIIIHPKDRAVKTIGNAKTQHPKPPSNQVSQGKRMKKKLAISARGLGQQITGAQKYIHGFITEWVKHQDQFEIHLYYNDPNHAGRFPQAHEHYLPSKNKLVWDHVLLPLALKKDDIDIAIFPKGTKSIISPTQDVVIMLDLGYFYKWLNAYRSLDTPYMKAMMRFSAKQAWKLLAISDSTKNDIVSILGIDQRKVKVIYSGCDEIYQPVTDPKELERVQQKYRLTRPFIFYPTSISPRKNLDRLLDALDIIGSDLPHQIYLTGSTGWKSDHVMARLKNPEYRNIHLLGQVDEQDMPAIYSLADFTMYISLVEGFGLPVLEAMRCGSPVLASDQTSIPEVTGNAALLVDPYSPADIAQGLLKISQDEALRKHLRAKGFEQAQKFSWERAVKTTLSFISD